MRGWPSSQHPKPQTLRLQTFDSRPTLEALASEQGVEPTGDFDALLGDFWPEDESADEFILTLREWRRDAPGA
jgi:hypothetical protein